MIHGRVDDSAVHIFWDNSNVFARAQDTCDDREGGGIEPGEHANVRINFRGMFKFARAGRTVEITIAAYEEWFELTPAST